VLDGIPVAAALAGRQAAGRLDRHRWRSWTRGGPPRDQVGDELLALVRRPGGRVDAEQALRGACAPGGCGTRPESR
jgi:hypothetical protein